MSDEQPEVRWAPIEPRPKNDRRIWIIVGSIVVAVLIVAALVFFLIPRSGEPAPGASGSPMPSASASPSLGDTAEPGTPAETPAPEITPPAPVEPTLDAFRTQVTGWLTDAPQGLDIVAGSSGDEALSVVDSLVDDAQRLSDTQAPSSIDPQWRDGVSAYSQRLSELRSAVSGGSGVPSAVDAARTAVQNLRGIVGL